MENDEIGRIRRVTTPEGHTDYIMEFPKRWVATMVPDNPLLAFSPVHTEMRVEEWEQVSLVDLIHALQR